MIGIVIVAHGGLAQEYLAAMEHVVGKQPGTAAIAISAECDREERRSAICSAMNDVDTGDGVVVVTDMFGGTPSNLAISAMDDGDIEVLAGANLPMLIKLASVRATLPLRQAAEAGQNAGRKYINRAGGLLDK